MEHPYTARPHIAVVVLSYQSRELLRQFLPLLIAYNRPDAEVWVVDNASTDGTAELLAAEFPAVRTLRLAVNRGFTNGYVQSLPQIAADYYVLINSDVAVTPGWLDPLAALLDANPQAAAVQPKILAHRQQTHFEYSGAAGGYLDTWGYPFCRGRIFDTVEADTGQYNDTRAVAWTTGACMMIRADVYHASGGLDNDFYAHMEEIDLCWRLRNQGHTLWVAPASVVYHVGGAVIRYGSHEKQYHNFRNSLLMIVKNEPGLRVWWVLLMHMVLDGVAALRFGLGGQPGFAWAVLHAHLGFYKRLPATLRKRNALQHVHKPVATTTKDATVYSGSIIWAYFVRCVKTFSGLKL